MIYILQICFLYVISVFFPKKNLLSLPGPPDLVTNCSVVHESLDSVRVRCQEGYNGGLPQNFIMEVYESQGLKLKVGEKTRKNWGLIKGPLDTIVLRCTGCFREASMMTRVNDVQDT